MNIQNKLYTVQFFFSPLYYRFAAGPWAAIVELRTRGFREFHETHGKDQTPRKKKESKRGFLPFPVQLPFINWAWHPWYGVFPLAILG